MLLVYFLDQVAPSMGDASVPVPVPRTGVPSTRSPPLSEVGFFEQKGREGGASAPAPRHTTPAPTGTKAPPKRHDKKPTPERVTPAPTPRGKNPLRECSTLRLLPM